MKLFLASEAKHPKTVEDIKEFIGDLKNCRLLYIPTAANGKTNPQWQTGGSYNTFSNLGTKFEVMELERNESDVIKTKFENSHVVFFAGGMGGYLLYWIYRREVNKYLRNLLENGLKYIGSSAGSMITSTDQDFAEWYIGEEEPGAAKIPGLGLVDFNFYPHYEESLYEEIKSKYNGNKMYLVENGESIIIEGENLRFIGEEKLIKEI